MSLFSKLLVSSALVVALFSIPAQSAELSGMVTLDGSSTVYPISAAVAEEFQREKQFNKVRVTVAYSGTGGGFKKWCKGETDINDASRPIKDKEESCAKENGISYVELPVAYDALSVVVSSKNKFLTTLTMAQLKQIFESGSKIKTWKDLDPQFPAEAVKLYSPGHDSGTFDYFTEAVMHESRSIRTENVVTSEDDNALVKGVTASANAMGYFGYAYYAENQSTLKALALDAGKGPVAPSMKSTEDGTYPLARPIFIYVSSKAAGRPEVQAFVSYYLKNARKIVESVRYVPMPQAKYDAALAKFESFTKKVAAAQPAKASQKKAE